MFKFRAVSLLAVIFLYSSLAQAALPARDQRLEGVVDIEKLSLSLELNKLSGQKKSAKSERLARQLLEEAGWVPNNDGVFTLRLENSVLAFDRDDALGHFYVMSLTRDVIPGKRPRPIATGSYLVVQEHLVAANYSKMSGFGYIGRGSHTSGTRYGVLPFNRDFIRLLAYGKVTSYIFTLPDFDPTAAMVKRRDYELYLKCRFTDKEHDYIRSQENIKISSSESPSSRRIIEYLLCVDVVGAFLYDRATERVIREWRVDPV